MNTADIPPGYSRTEGSTVMTGSSLSAVAWPAIIAGAFAAAAVSLVLLTLGAGIGLAFVSPWGHNHPSIMAFTVKTAIGLIVIQWVASGLGGYLAGRLRTKWTGVHTHEVFFRDTAHGFLTWAVATVITATLLASAASSVANGGAAASAVASDAAIAGMATPEMRLGDIRAIQTLILWIASSDPIMSTLTARATISVLKVPVSLPMILKTAISRQKIEHIFLS
jgi:hypothetical protein